MTRRLDPVMALTLFLLPVGYLWNGELWGFPGLRSIPRIALVLFLCWLLLRNRIGICERHHRTLLVVEILVLLFLIELVGRDVLRYVLTDLKSLALWVALRGGFCLYGYYAIGIGGLKVRPLHRLFVCGLGGILMVLSLVSHEITVNAWLSVVLAAMLFAE